MCKLGDIIVVNKYIGENGKHIGRHSFIVIDDNEDIIRGIKYTHIATVISSFKSKEQKRKKLNYYVLGRVSDDLLEEIKQIIIELANENKLTQVISNL